MPRHTTAATPLAWACVLLVLYASLYPFSDWRWPPGRAVVDLLMLPWPPWRDPFDLWANLLGYLPLGWLLAIALRSRLTSSLMSLAMAVLIAASGSYLVEAAQNFLPGRHPSAKDWAMNTLGAALGATLALLLRRLGPAHRWAWLRERWLVPQSGGAIALLSLWPLALLYPTPLPLGLGQIADKLRDGLLWVTEGVTWAQPANEWLQSGAGTPGQLSPAGEGLAIALGLFGPCMLGYAVARPGVPRLLLSLGAALVATSTMTLSALLNYGPQHAAGWLTVATPPAMAGAVFASLALATVPRRVACGLALMALAGSLALVAQVPSDPFFALNLQAWEQGRWVRFHGVTQWVGLLWPYVAMAWLLRRLARPDDALR
jgi:VanZ family protein